MFFFSVSLHEECWEKEHSSTTRLYRLQCEFAVRVFIHYRNRGWCWIQIRSRRKKAIEIPRTARQARAKRRDAKSVWTPKRLMLKNCSVNKVKFSRSLWTRLLPNTFPRIKKRNRQENTTTFDKSTSPFRRSIYILTQQTKTNNSSTLTWFSSRPLTVLASSSGSSVVA